VVRSTARARHPRTSVVGGLPRRPSRPGRPHRRRGRPRRQRPHASAPGARTPGRRTPARLRAPGGSWRHRNGTSSRGRYVCPCVNRRDFLAAAAVAPYALRTHLAQPAVALVTCDAESRLSLVDLRTLRVVGSISTPPDPRSIETVGNLAVVCHTAEGAVSVVDRDRVRHVIRGFVEPRYTAAHPDGVHAFVTDSGRSGVAAVDLRRGIVVGRVKLPGWARHLTIAP